MRKVYLDHSATSPVLPEVRDAMLPFLGEIFSNPSSLHGWGDPSRRTATNLWGWRKKAEK